MTAVAPAVRLMTVAAVTGAVMTVAAVAAVRPVGGNRELERAGDAGERDERDEAAASRWMSSPDGQL